jgi:hypothetical protein
MDLAADTLGQCHVLQVGARLSAHRLRGRDGSACFEHPLHVQRVGARLEAEMQQRAEDFWSKHHENDAIDAQAAVHALQTDAGYVRSIARVDGTNWVPVIASKIVRPQSHRTHAYAFSSSSKQLRGTRQKAFLASVGRV